MIRDVILALGILLSTGSQLRPEGFPFGPGEVFLGLWVAVAAVCEIARLGPPLTPALSRLVMFWLVFAAAQVVGLQIGLALETYRDVFGALHDVAAYILMAAMTLLIVALPDNVRRLRRVTWFVVVSGVGSLLVQLACARGMIKIQAIDPWYFDRFRGWAENPNQMALFCSALALLALHLADTAARFGERAAAVACMAVFVFGGVFTKSDSFILFALMAFPMYLGFKIWTWLFMAGPGVTLRTTFACLSVLAIPPLAAAALPVSPAIVDQVEKVTTKMLEDNNQAEARFKLWKEALQIGISAKLLGFGPGPHLNSKDYKRPPPAKFEAHNTILDLFTQGGLLAIATFVWLMATSFLAAHRARLFALSTLVGALCLFSMFHLIVRQPIFWFAIAFTLAAADSVRSRPPRPDKEQPA